MTTIDIRSLPASPVERIIFADPSTYPQRVDVAYQIQNLPNLHTEYIFLEAAGTTYATLRLRDIPALILALQKAQEIWSVKE